MPRTEHHSSAHKDIPNKPGVTNWVEDNGGLPPYMDRVAKHIHADSPGYTWERAIAAAVSQTKKRAAAGNPEAIRAVAQWEAMRAAARATPNRSDRGRAVEATRPSREHTVGLPPQFQKKAGSGPPPKGGAGATPPKGGAPGKGKGGRPIQSVGDVRAAAAAWQSMPEGPAKVAAASRLLAAARKIGPEAVKFVPKGGGGNTGRGKTAATR